jgi:hypothetical protein
VTVSFAYDFPTFLWTGTLLPRLIENDGDMKIKSKLFSGVSELQIGDIETFA